jgi:putative membrane protein
MRKLAVLASTVLMTGGLMIAQAPATGSGSSTNSAATSSQSEKAKPSATGSAKSDHSFVMKAAQGGLAEVELGQLAAQKASNPDVKAFGQKMVDDHTKANDQLKQIASQQNIAIPTEPAAKDKAEKERLSKLSGDAFDKAYMSHMVADHKKDVAEFQKEANSGKDDAVKNFAQQTLPTLQSHLQMAQDTDKKVKGSSASASKSSKGNSSSASASTPQ